MKKRNPNMIPMHFIQADSRALFNVNDQDKIFSHMTNDNRDKIEKYLSGKKKYDVINSQFTMHYYLNTEDSWNNFCKNINDHLSSNGYVLITTFDGEFIYDKLKDKKNISSEYININGEKEILFDIKKVYSDKRNPNLGIGFGIDLYNSLISEAGVYNREYLVFSEFLEKSFSEKCDLELIESDSFYNLFKIYRNYFSLPKNNYLNIPKKYMIVFLIIII